MICDSLGRCGAAWAAPDSDEVSADEHVGDGGVGGLLCRAGGCADEAADAGGAIKQARKLSAPEPLVAYIKAQPAVVQADLWDQALGQLWQVYDRELVARTLVEVAPGERS